MHTTINALLLGCILVVCVLHVLVSGETVPLKVKSVLVLGGTGRVGSTVAAKLVAQGTETRVLTRDATKANAMEILKGCSIIEGDVNNMDDILKASSGCSAVIAAHGVKPIRFFKLRDLFNHPRTDPTHPYNVNFIATKRVLAAMQINKVQHLVRITGALVDKSAFLPLVFLFNFLLSKSVKWHEATEIAIRASGVDYTVIRPTGIRETVDLRSKKMKEAGTPPLPTRLVLLPGDSGLVPKLPGQISISNVADLCILALQGESAGRLSQATVIISSEGGEGPTSWGPLLHDKAVAFKDSKVLRARRHNLSFLLYSALLAGMASIIMKGIVSLGRRALSLAVLGK